MSNTTIERTPEVVKQDINPSRMVHWTHNSTPTIAICGAKIAGCLRDDVDSVDCHICAEILGMS
jgi:hypothetical protein